MVIDDLLILLELWRAGRVKDVAHRLQINDTTVSRRISRLERALNTRLVDRDPRGWRLTETGLDLLPYAEDVERASIALKEDFRGESHSLGGTVRVVAPDGFGTFILAPDLSGIRREHPSLKVELLTLTSNDALSSRDFDIGITLERPSSTSALVSHLCDYTLRLYASPEYLAARGVPGSIEEAASRHLLIWYIDSLLDVQPLQLLTHLLPGAQAGFQSNNISAHLAAARGGAGIAPLPTYIGDRHDDLVCVLPGDFSVERSYWMTVPRSAFNHNHVALVRKIVHRIVDSHPQLDARVA